MQSIPTCSVADVAAAARAQGLSLEETVERAMDIAGRTAAERLYVGSNFCSQYFLRQPMSLWSEAFALCRQRGMAATLVVPVVSQRDLASACSLVEELLNSHGDLVDEIQAAYGVYDGIVINPAAYTHTSVAILDALKAVAIPAVEVHLSDVTQREDFRQISYARLACVKTFMGLGFEGYRQAILFLKSYINA